MQCRGLSSVRIWDQSGVSYLLTALEIDSVRSSLQIVTTTAEFWQPYYYFSFRL